MAGSSHFDTRFSLLAFNRMFLLVFDARSLFTFCGLYLLYLERHCHYCWFLSRLLTTFIIGWYSDDVLAYSTLVHIFACSNLYFVRVEMECKTWILFDEIQAASSLWIIMNCSMTLLIGWMRPYLSLLVDPFFTGWLCPYLGSRFLYTLLWMAAPIPHIMYQRYQFYLYSQVFQRKFLQLDTFS